MNIRKLSGYIFLISFISFFSSCKIYRTHIMFKTDKSVIVDSLDIKEVEGKYKIQENDILEIKVYSNKGEILIDPDFTLRQELDISPQMSSMNSSSNQYLVMSDGNIKLPIIGFVKVAGQNIEELQKLIENKYSNMYNEPFVLVKLLNRRVVLFGPGGGEVIPIENENMNLLEVLALAGAATTQIRSYNIRLIRGDLTNPNVILVDLSTIEGMRKTNLKIKNNDIIYIESKGNSVKETLSTISPIIQVLMSLLTLYIIIGR